jgi:hypothetical protein
MQPRRFLRSLSQAIHLEFSLEFPVPVLAALALASSLALIGCARNEDDDVATASVTSALQASQHGGITQDIVSVDGEAAIEPTKAAQFVATRRPVGVQPEGCMTRTQNADSVHFVFTGCTGPFGKVRLDGSADARFSLDEKQRLVATITSGADLRANDRALSYKAQGTVEVQGDIRNLTWHAEATGETKRGRKYSRSTDLAISVDIVKRCLQASGAAHGTIAGFDLDVTVDDLAVCESACPTSGKAEASLRGPAGSERSFSIAFDGTDKAHVKTPRRELDIALACADGEAAE